MNSIVQLLQLQHYQCQLTKNNLNYLPTTQSNITDPF